MQDEPYFRWGVPRSSYRETIKGRVRRVLMPLRARGVRVMSFESIYMSTVVPRRYCHRYTRLGPDQARLPSSLSVSRTVGEESCLLLADLGATREFVSKLGVDASSAHLEKTTFNFQLPRRNTLTCLEVGWISCTRCRRFRLPCLSRDRVRQKKA